jgi:hypothetical protein
MPSGTRQLGYKQPNYVRSIELVESFAAIRGGKAATGKMKATSGIPGFR